MLFFFYLSSQELASQDEKLHLMESSLKATQEQLTEQRAEIVRQEQNSTKSQAELKTVRERTIASEEEINDYKVTFCRDAYFLKNDLLSIVILPHHSTVEGQV
ncbi:uncharacterized protein ACOB8E_014336 [Sarcophilus harrisii]